MQVQTRDVDGGLRYFKTVGDAMREAEKENSTIWKISWTDESGERIRLVQDEEYPGIWVYGPLMDNVFKELLENDIITLDQAREIMGIRQRERPEE